jgi:hypothetical protein
MSLDTYPGLAAEIGDWLDRDDLTARVPTFIRLTEARLNRLLEDPDMEVSTTLTGDGADLPADYGAMISIGTANGYKLTPMSNVEYAKLLPSSGISRYYTIREGKVYYYPGSANVTLVYRRRIPALTADNQMNWLLDLAPDAYLYGALMQASAFLVEDDRAQNWNALFDRAIEELRIDAAKRKWGAGPIAPRLGRT